MGEKRLRALGLQLAVVQPVLLVKQSSPNLQAAVTPNPSLKRSANGRPPGPGLRYGVHFLSPGPGVLPSSPA